MGLALATVTPYQKTTLPAHGIHFSTPVILLASLLCGVVFALAHHFFYLNLTGAPALNSHVLLNVTQQRFNLAVGNALAFAVKVSLGIAVATAYYQFFWARVRTSSRGQRLQNLDITFSALEDGWNLFNLKAWYKFPLMFIVASLAWCIPLASIVTPSTLSVRNVLRTPATMTYLSTPDLDFASLNFLAPMIYNGTFNWWQYFGSNPSVRRVATAALNTGEILPIGLASGQANATWTTNFWGPSLSCSNATQQDARAIWYNVLENIEPTEGTDPPYWPCYQLTTYASWSDNGHNWLPFNNGNLIDDSLTFNGSQRMFAAIMPWSREQFQQLCGFQGSGNILQAVYQQPDSAKDQYLPFLFGNASLVECRAVNASYTVHFDYVNGQQNLSIAIDKSDQPVIPLKNVTGPVVLPPATGWPTNGEDTRTNCSTLNSQGTRCMFDVVTLQTLAYQAVIDTFSAVLYGTLTLTNPAVQRLIFYNSHVSQTRLMDTKELAWVNQYPYVTSQQVNLTKQMLSQAGTDYIGLSNDAPVYDSGDLATFIEGLFTNFTISLMSDSYLLPNYSSPFAPPALRQVTITDYHNVYDYEASTLWIAYGAAIGVSCIISLAGLVAIWTNGASYDNRFSTVMRVSRNAGLASASGEDEGTDDDDGRRPLPEGLRKATMTMRPGRTNADSRELLTQEVR